MDEIGIIVSDDDPKNLAMATNLGHVALTMDTDPSARRCWIASGW